MRKIWIALCVVAAMMITACDKQQGQKLQGEAITLTSPQPTVPLTKVSLTSEQQGYVKAGNVFALRCLPLLHQQNPGSLVFSPLSLQYALSMAANGASGETLEEICVAMGVGKGGLEALNALNHTLLTELPAVDLDVTLRLADAILVSDRYTLQKDYQDLLAQQYYAPAEYLNFSNLDPLVARINDWASRNTNGLIKPFLDKKQLTGQEIAILLNALYFKSKWASLGGEVMFDPDFTQKDQTFAKSNGTEIKVEMMRHTGFRAYAQYEGFQMLELPYSNGKYVMYILLPDQKNGIGTLLSSLPTLSWPELTASLTNEARVHLKLPKFDIESTLDLPKTLMALGIQSAFCNAAKFDRMIEGRDDGICISKVLQKAKIAVAEWGTEAAAVTAIIFAETAPGPDPEIKDVYFTADHPFVWVIAEKSSGTILFEGIFDGK